MALGSMTSRISITGTQTGSNDVTTPTETYNVTHTTDWTNGTGDDQISKVWQDTRTINASTAEDLDLAGSLTDSFGNTVTFATVKFVYVSAASGNTNNVEVGGSAANTMLGIFDDATDKVLVKPGGVFYWEAPGTGATVTAGTGDKLNVNNSGAGTSVEYTIVIGGTT
jgi:hypothetical protein